MQVNGSVMLLHDMDPTSMASDVIHMKLVREPTVKKVEDWIEAVTPDDIQ